MRTLARQLALAAALAALVSGALCASAMAQLVVITSPSAPHGRVISITPHAGVSVSLPRAHIAPHALPRQSPACSGLAVNCLQYGGGPVLHSNQTVAIFWLGGGAGNAFAPDDNTFETLVNRYLGDVAHDSRTHGNVYSVAEQYADAGGRAAYASSFARTFVDTRAYPTSGNCVDSNTSLTDPCLTDGQIQAELGQLIGASQVPTGPNVIYYVFTPQGVHDCTSQTPVLLTDCSDSPEGFCGYHSPSSSGALYAVMPDDSVPNCTGTGPPLGTGDRAEGFPNDPTGSVDPVLSTLSHEHIETVTDPFGNAWADSSGMEIADKCAYTYGAPIGSAGGQPFNQSIDAHPYDIQEEWSNDGAACLQRYDIPPSASFTTGSALAGTPTSFDSRSSNDPDGAVVAQAWSFGDGSGASGATASHTYAAPGVYNVSLTVTDDGGRRATTTKQIAVADPAPIASFSWSPGDADRNQTVMFDGTGSRAPVASITTYAWNFGDGTQASGARAGHSYSRAGDYTVTLTVRDSFGMTASQTQRVAIADPPLSITMPRSPVMRKAARFSVRVRGRDPDGDRVTGFRWDFGDGRHASGKSPSHTYGEGGRYAVKLTITSSDGVSTTITRSLGVRFVKPRGSLRTPGQSVAGVLAKGFKTGYKADEPGRGLLELRVGGRRGAVLGRLRFSPRVGRGNLVLKLPASAAGRLRGRHNVKVTLRFVLTNPARQSVTVLRSVTLR